MGLGFCMPREAWRLPPPNLFNGSPGGRAGQREGGGGRGAPAAGRAAGEVHPPRQPTDAGARHPTKHPPPPPALQHRPRRRRAHPPPKHSRPQHQPAPPTARAEPARMASAGGGGGARHQRRRHRGSRGSRREGQRGPGPGTGMGHGPGPSWEALPLVGEVYGWLSWANQGTTRGLRNRPFDAVLLRRDGGNQEVPLGGWAAREDHERVLRSVIWALWPDRGPTWPAFLEGAAVLRVTDADANNWLPPALRSALAHWRCRRRKPPPPQPQPPHKRRRR